MNSLAQKQSIEFERVQISDQITFLCAAFPGCVALKKTQQVAGAPGKEIYEVSDVLGGIHHLEGEAGPSGKLTLRLVEVARAPIQKISAENRQQLREAYLQEGIQRLSSHQLATYLSERQLRNSTNARAAQGAEGYIEGVHLANLLLANLLKNNSDFTVNHLETLNYHLNKGINPHGEARHQHRAGVQRGTRNRLAIMFGEEVLVDTNGMNIFQGGNGRKITGFAPATMVPGLVSDLVNRIQRVRENTPLEEIFTIYQEFIRIHPFIDANGRTGRVMLNYLLLKAGYPPNTRASESLYFSAEELVRQYAQDILRN